MLSDTETGMLSKGVKYTFTIIDYTPAATMQITGDNLNYLRSHRKKTWIPGILLYCKQFIQT